MASTLPSLGPQRDGTFVVPSYVAQARPVVPVETPLVSEANALVDAYAEVLSRALSKHQGRVKPDEIRAILLSAYIQRRRSARA